MQLAVRIVSSELYVLISLAGDYFLFPSKIFPFFSLPFFSLSSYFGLQRYLTRYSSTSVCLSVCLSLSHTQSVTHIHFFPHAFPWSQTSSCRISSSFIYYNCCIAVICRNSNETTANYYPVVISYRFTIVCIQMQVFI